jgi:hypothetical protein
MTRAEFVAKMIQKLRDGEAELRFYTPPPPFPPAR